MDESTGLWKRIGGKVNKKVLFFSLLALMLILFAGGFPGVLPRPFSRACMLLAEIILVILILWAAVAFQGKPQGSYLVDRYPAEFDKVADLFQKGVDEAILKKLAKLPNFNQFYLAELYSLSMERFSQECAKRTEIVADDELRFFLFAQKANYEAMADNYASAEECLREALSFDPNIFILWLRLAEVRERLGAGPEAVAAYDRALELAPEKPPIKEYLRTQIHRVQTQGPRKQMPLQGFRYVSA
jgi:tetratricopeptide (TPR) repeat protein